MPGRVRLKPSLPGRAWLNKTNFGWHPDVVSGEWSVVEEQVSVWTTHHSPHVTPLCHLLRAPDAGLANLPPLVPFGRGKGHPHCVLLQQID